LPRISCINLIINLVEQSILGSLGKVELLAEFLDDVLWELTLIDLDVLDILAAIKLYLKDADWLLRHLRLSLCWLVLGEVLLLWRKRGWFELVRLSSWSVTTFASLVSLSSGLSLWASLLVSASWVRLLSWVHLLVWLWWTLGLEALLVIFTERVGSVLLVLGGVLLDWSHGLLFPGWSSWFRVSHWHWVSVLLDELLWWARSHWGS